MKRTNNDKCIEEYDESEMKKLEELLKEMGMKL